MPFNSKWFRENTRTIVFIFMALLLVVFLIQDNFQYFNSGRQERAQTFGRATAYNISIDTDRLRAANAARVICAGAGMQIGGYPLAQLPIQGLEFLLLREEARRVGIQVGRQEVQSWLRGDGSNPNVDKIVNDIALNQGIGVNAVLDALGDGLAIAKSFYVQSLGHSDSMARMRQKFRDRSEQAVFECATIDANQLIDDVAEPTEEELQAFFEKYRDIEPPTTQSGEELKFGYRLPDRVKIEWVTLDPSQIKAPPIRSKDVRQHFERNAAQYTKPGPSTDAAETSVNLIPMTFEEAEQRVRADVRELRSIEEARKIIDGLRRDANAQWSGADTDENGFRKAPATQVSLSELHQRMLADVPALSYQVSPLVSERELSQLLGMAQPELRLNQQYQLNLSSFAFRCAGLLKKVERGDPLPALAVGEPSPVLMATRPIQGKRLDYQAYVFRVLETAPSAPPAALADVREAVVRDLKLSRAFELAKAKAEAISVAAKANGLKAAVEAAADVRRMLGEPAPVEGAASQPALPAAVQRALDQFKVKTPSGIFSRSSPSITMVDRFPDLAGRVFGLADEAGPHRVTTLGGASSKTWTVLELTEIKPAYEGDFAITKRGLMENAGMTVQFGLLTPEAIRKRAGWQFAAGFADEAP
ncbi:MAG: hypothetical protein SF069_05415 [Phycisphaerae bacterium]|nr:hypothetical protein [Phycisphaerae bacterium]